jgi:ubiquinone biosynthesis protein Coq4
MNTHAYDSLYTQESENLTLKEALDEHYRVNPTFTRYDEFEREKSQILMRAHDMSHVIFGCDTHLLGEMRVQTWVSYGCIFPLWKKISYA